ncbi:MAG: hypothetical protein GVY29_13485 [Spirochaetes bacterium]|jgi:hypothetical protein|nr:hypothetical protein [Spirochaetota bacterium]
MYTHHKVRFLSIMAVLLVLTSGLAIAQNVNYSTFEDSFESFASDVASSLPLNSSIGNNTPDAYIGQLLSAPPHFSIGVTTGASTIPYKTIEAAMKDLDLDTGAIDQFSGIGVPLPAYTVDARVGGFILPFDVGLKIGGVPRTNFGMMPADLEYFLVGADVRYAVIEQGAVLPNVSVGVGYNYLSGQVFVPDVFSGGYSFPVPDGSGRTLEFTDPDLTFNWQSSVIDFKVQASKQFLVVTPFAGLGTSVGLSSAGGGLDSEVLLDNNPISESQANQLEQDIEDAGFDAPNLDPDQGIAIGSDVNGWGLRAFGGVGFNILALKLDLGLGYDVLGGNVMGSLSARFQL